MFTSFVKKAISEKPFVSLGPHASAVSFSLYDIIARDVVNRGLSKYIHGKQDELEAHFKYMRAAGFFEP